MAHAKINLQQMLDWIETCQRDDVAMPDDGAICTRFGFETPESARTLLAELADAGKITIKGYGPTRTISLGRVRAALAAVGRVRPPIGKVDPDIERTAARLAEIVQRGRPARAIIAENAGKLLAAVTPPAPVVAKAVPKEPVMPAKTISLPGSAATAIAAVEQLAKRDDLAIGHAAAVLIERGAARTEPVAAPAATTATAPLSFDVLLDLIRERFAERPDQSDALAAAIARADAADARAQAAEEKLATAKALFA
jgi:hypothetical protein